MEQLPRIMCQLWPAFWPTNAASVAVKQSSIVCFDFRYIIKSVRGTLAQVNHGKLMLALGSKVWLSLPGQNQILMQNV
jgi:hypothetical protein